MKKRGFTLIELLAVIVVMSIVALITTSIIFNVIENSKKGIVLESARAVVKAMDEYDLDSDYTGNEELVDITGDTLNINGKKPEVGFASINSNSQVKMYMYLDGYCAAKTYSTDIKVIKTYKDNCLAENYYAGLDVTYSNPSNQLTLNSIDGLRIIGNADQSSLEQYYQGGFLPSEYQRVDYIESLGNQYIDTGIPAADNVGIKIDFSVNSIVDQVIAGAKNGANTSFYINPYTKLYMSWNGLYDSNFAISANTRYSVSMNYKNDRKRIINGVEYATINSILSTANTRNIYLFAANYEGTVNYSSSGKIYGCQITQGDTIIANLIPSFRKSDGALGFYDTVRNSFLTTPGGSFQTAPSSSTYLMSFGERTKNLFNKSSAQLGVDLAIGTGSVYNNVDRFVSDYIPVTAGTTYYINYKTAKYGCFYNSNKVFLGTGNCFTSRSFTPPSGTAFIRFAGLQNELDTLQLEIGTGATNYIPYSNGNINLTVSGKNLFNKEECPFVQFTQYHVAVIKNSALFNLKAGTYTASYNVNIGKQHQFFIFNESNEQEFYRFVTDISGNQKVTFAIPNDGMYYIRIATNDNSYPLNNKIDGFNNTFQIEMGSNATNYESHSDSRTVTFNIDGHESLRRIEDKYDYIDYGTRQIVRQTGKLDLTESQNWKKSGDHLFYADVNNLKEGTMLSNYYYYADVNPSNLLNYQITNKGNTIWVKDDRYSDVSQFKANLSSKNSLGNQATIYYILEKTTVESVTLPNINISSGSSISLTSSGINGNLSLKTINNP